MKSVAFVRDSCSLTWRWQSQKRNPSNRTNPTQMKRTHSVAMATTWMRPIHLVLTPTTVTHLEVETEATTMTMKIHLAVV